MLLLPYLKHQKRDHENTTRHGFSFTLLPISVVLLLLFLNLMGLSILYHGTLYNYASPTWGWLLIFVTVVSLGLRVRLSLAQDFKKSFREVTLWGVPLKKKSFDANHFKGFELRPTGVVDGQYYYVLNSEEGSTSIHYAKIPTKKVQQFEGLFSVLLGFKDVN